MIRSRYWFAVFCFLMAAAVAAPMSAQRSSVELQAGEQSKDWKDRVQLGSPIVIEADQARQNLICIACPVQVKGRAEDVVVLFDSADIQGSLKGDLVVLGGNVRLGPAANISGDVVVTGELQRAPEARVGGEVVQSPFKFRASLLAGFFLTGLAFIPVALVASLLCYAVAGEGRISNVAAAFAYKPMMAFAAGAGVFVAAIALILLFQRMHPLTPWLIGAEALGFVAAMILGYTGLSSWMGRAVSVRPPLAAVLAGALIIVVAQAIPFLGAVVFLVFMLMALGSTALSGYGTSADWLDRRLGAPATMSGPRR
jgi:hypothetical protein